MQTEESKIPFKPILQAPKIDLSYFDRSTIIEKSSLYHVEKEERMEQLKIKHRLKQDDEEQFEFKPRINSVSKRIPRNLNDLYVHYYVLSITFI